MNESQHHQPMPRLWGLGVLALALHWLEELVNTLAGPLLVVGLGIALVDLLTDGKLTAHVPTLLYVWAISQAAGVDAQLVGSFARARHALRTRRYWELVGLLALGAVLAYVGWIAAEVFATEQAQHLTTAQALSRLGMDQTAWIVQRAALAVFLVALSGWTRYHPPAKDAAVSAETERQHLERELVLEPLRQQARAQKAIGAVGLARQTLAAARGQRVQDGPPERPPTGPGSPLTVAHASKPSRPDAKPRRTAEPSLELVAPPEWQEPQRPRRRTASAEVRVRRVLEREPDISTRRLAKRAHVSDSTASKHRALWRQEQEQHQQRAQ